MDGFARRGRLLVLGLLALAFVLPGAATAQEDAGSGEPGAERPSFQAPAGAPEAVPGQVIVKFEEDATGAEEADARRDEGLQKEEDLDLIDAEVAKVEGQPVEQAVRDLEARPDVEYAEPDYLLYRTGYADEPRFGELWGLNNTGQSVKGTTGAADVDVNAPEATAATQGDPNLVVAVIDDGVDFSHPDLAGRAWANPGEAGGVRGRDDDNNGKVDDVNGWDFYHGDATIFENAEEDFHSSHVAGTIAASVNDKGVVGVAPNVKIMSLKFCGKVECPTSKAIEAIEYATKEGAKISNNSWGGPDSTGLKEAIERSGQLFVAAAGNDGLNNDSSKYRSYPASYTSPNILSVAAVDSRGRLADFSNYGATSVDVSAPGVNILSTLPGGAYGYYNGTSMATPHATGVAVLAASVNPTLLDDPVALKKVIMDSAKTTPATSCKTATGGMVDAGAAVGATAVVPPPADTTAPTGKVVINGGASSTRNTTVRLTLSATDNLGGTCVKEMRVSNDKRRWSAWGPYATSRSWKLASGRGKRTVYVEFRDGAGNVSSPPASDSIRRR